MTYREKFEAMVDILERNPHINITKVKFRNPTKPSFIKWAKESAGGTLPSAMEAFYQSMNGFTLEWEQTLPDVETQGLTGKGFIDIEPLHRVLGDWKDIVWFEQIESSLQFKPLKPVDFFMEEACTCLLQPDGKPIQDEIVYHYLGEYTSHTHHTFEEWIDKLLLSRGYFYWIQTLCSEWQSSPEVKSFREVMPKLFDDYDDTVFQPKSL